MGNIWLQTVLPRLLRQYRIELFHSPMFVLPLGSRVPAVITVHYLVHRVFPETTDWKNRLPLNVLLPPSINRARRIIAVSEHTKGDLIKYHHVDPEKIRVIYLGNDQRFHQIKDISGMEKVRADYDLPRRYILTVGTLEPRKNLVGLFKAFSILLKKVPDLKHQLVVVGARGWQFHGIFTALRDFGLEGMVVFTDYVSNENLPLIYKGADLFVFPSLYEGFGLPPLEAMASGIPIIVSRAASLPEVVGEAAVLVNPYDPEELSRAMEMVLFDKKRKTDMVIKGLEQVKKFSWEKAARETRAVYREVLAGNYTA
ncbi:MAG: glycosyltransferase family 1 protein [Desulfitobacteriaceae bacterium]|nr:glycosyltransferase family 1 protein [Desulfitobacteriaceae bacterium]